MKLIPLSKSRFKGRYVMVDDEDFEYLNKWNWCFGARRYAARTVVKGYKGKKITILMHRVVNKTPEGMDTCHLDNDGLNNQKHNLRTGTTCDNLQMAAGNKNTTSKYKGVHWDRAKEKWVAQIRVKMIPHHLGRFVDEVEAAKAYDKGARTYFGPFCFLNFPEGEICA